MLEARFCGIGRRWPLIFRPICLFCMTVAISQTQSPPPLIPQGDYVKTLRPHLPEAAFQPDASKFVLLLINLAILGLGWAMAARFDHWPAWAIALFLPLSLVMGNSVVVLLFTSHDLLHGSAVRQTKFTDAIAFLALTVMWMPPTLWKSLHNRVHHSNTNAIADPDRNYRHDDPFTWGKWIQNAYTPSNTVSPIGFVLGMTMAWGVYAFRNITAVVFFNREGLAYVPASFAVSEAKRRAIAVEWVAMMAIHLGIMAALHFNPLALALAYFLPIGLGYAGVIGYIYTNHLVSPMMEVNDPLANSISLKLPKILDVLHCNFSYHAEHHIFPSINSDYYPQVRELIQQHYPDRMGYLRSGGAVWRSLLSTPRHYANETTLTTWEGDQVAPCLTLEDGAEG